MRGRHRGLWPRWRHQSIKFAQHRGEVSRSAGRLLVETSAEQVGQSAGDLLPVLKRRLRRAEQSETAGLAETVHVGVGADFDALEFAHLLRGGVVDGAGNTRSGKGAIDRGAHGAAFRLGPHGQAEIDELGFP